MLLQPLWRIVCRFLKKLKNRTVIGSSIPTPGYMSRKKKKSNSKTHAPQCQCSTIYNRQDMEEIQVSISRQLDKEDVVYISIYNGILLGIFCFQRLSLVQLKDKQLKQIHRICFAFNNSHCNCMCVLLYNLFNK